MEKMKMHTPDLTEDNVAKIARLFPNCVTETMDDDGNLRRAVDFDLLKQELSPSLVDGAAERYHLDWVGKREALLAANAPVAKTLRPVRGESVDFDRTKNLYIEGDNLDALKLLQETYLGKVKMIYIDPPYNTGNDFIYNDDFAEDKTAYFERSMQTDESGNRLVANSESNGRFHSDWLSMMYPRLKLARNLLTDDGVIFISIDDNEQANLKRLCDEIFGAENFVAEFVWKRRSGSNDALKNVSLDHEYIIAFSKESDILLTGNVKDVNRYQNPDNDVRGAWAKDNLTCGKTASERPNLFYEIINPKTSIAYQCDPNHVWRFEKSKMMELIEVDKIIFPKSKSGKPYYKRHHSELRSDTKPIGSIIDTVLNSVATKETREILGGQLFNYPKSIDLLKKIIEQGILGNDIILDFFSGSATTAHAVMQLNAEDGGNRQFIMVQLPEKTGEQSEAFKAGYQTIADIGKERIRRAGTKIKAEAERKNAENKESLFDDESEIPLDTGFRVLKIDTSNMKDVYYAPDATAQADLLDAVSHIKEDRSDEDLLFQILLDWGVNLSAEIRRETIAGKNVWFVAETAIAACFDAGINEDFVKELAKRKPLRAVFRDSGFETDNAKINAEQIFKLMSPSTDVKTI